MAWTAGVTKATGDLITAAIWNNYMGAAGSIQYLYDEAKELWVPVTYGTLMVNYGTFPVARCLNAAEVGFISFKCPYDYSTTTEAKIYVIAKDTVTANWDIAAYMGADTQNYNTHTGSDDSSTYAVTSGKIYGIDCSGPINQMAAGDIVGVSLTQADSAHNVDILGLYLKYT